MERHISAHALKNYPTSRGRILINFWPQQNQKSDPSRKTGQTGTELLVCNTKLGPGDRGFGKKQDPRPESLQSDTEPCVMYLLNEDSGDRTGGGRLAPAPCILHGGAAPLRELRVGFGVRVCLCVLYSFYERNTDLHTVNVRDVCSTKTPWARQD